MQEMDESCAEIIQRLKEVERMEKSRLEMEEVVGRRERLEELK